MRISRILLVVLIAVALCGFSQKSSAQYTTEQWQAKKAQDLKAWIGKPFPPFCFPDSSGRIYTNKDFLGKVTLVDIWELGCSPCMFSIKYLNAIHDSLQRRGFQLLSILKNDLGIWKKFEGGAQVRQHFSLPQYNIISMESSAQTPQNIAAAEQLNATGWPFFMVVDGRGIVRAVRSGFATGDDIHEERPAVAPFRNLTISRIMSDLEKVPPSSER